MWLWIVVAVAAVMHAAVISDEENRRIRNAKECLESRRMKWYLR